MRKRYILTWLWEQRWDRYIHICFVVIPNLKNRVFLISILVPNEYRKMKKIEINIFNIYWIRILIYLLLHRRYKYGIYRSIKKRFFFINLLIITCDECYI